ncbi:MAG TPA: HD domain-containing phosphohydrolase [Solirubrobacterales bacterium]|nr:HD domain-containing phosphohydrolase [Solirubrobacterales bacterium]
MPEQPSTPDAARSRIAALREAVAAGEYHIDAELVVEAIVLRLTGLEVPSELPAPRLVPEEIVLRLTGRELSTEAPATESGGPEIALAPSRPSTEELARAQLNRYAIDLRRSYEREMKRSTDLEEAVVATVRSLATVAERDDGTGNHIQRVHDLGLLLAREVVPEEADDPELAYGFILHDIGKVAVPDAVLRKAGPLDEEESEIMRAHPEIGARILEPLPFLRRAREVVLHHHERWDGSGYPHGLAGEEIPLWARIFSVVNLADTMMSEGPYGSVPLVDVLAEVSLRSGTHFDPRCVGRFLALDRHEVLRSLQPAAENRLVSLAA